MRHLDAGSRTLESSTTWSLIVAGGSGLRFGGRKQFAPLGGQTVLERSVRAAATCSRGMVLVVPHDMVKLVSKDFDGMFEDVDVVVVAGGASRAGSVRAGLAALPDECDVVLVHDAARPLASAELFGLVVAAVVAGAEAVVPGVAVSDTIRDRDGGVVDRDRLLAVQTPQGFLRTTLDDAHASGVEATDDATLVEAIGVSVLVIDGEVANRKITEQADLVAFTAILEDRDEQ